MKFLKTTKWLLFILPLFVYSSGSFAHKFLWTPMETVNITDPTFIVSYPDAMTGSIGITFPGGNTYSKVIQRICKNGTAYDGYKAPIIAIPQNISDLTLSLTTNLWLLSSNVPSSVTDPKTGNMVMYNIYAYQYQHNYGGEPMTSDTCFKLGYKSSWVDYKQVDVDIGVTITSQDLPTGLQFIEVPFFVGFWENKDAVSFDSIDDDLIVTVGQKIVSNIAVVVNSVCEFDSLDNSGSQTITLDHGIMTPGEAVNHESTTSTIQVSCNAAANIKVSIENHDNIDCQKGTCTVTATRESTGSVVNDTGSSIFIPKDGTENITLQSTFTADSGVTPGSFSGSTVVRLDIL